MSADLSGPFARAASAYVDHGLWVIPCCWPDRRGRCQCGWQHQGKAIGKAPRIPSYDPHSRPTPVLVDVWRRTLPAANIAILLAPSELLIVDDDSLEADAEARTLGCPDTYTVSTAHGHHRYYRRPPGCPLTRRARAGRSGRLDILTLGYVIAPPSMHRTGIRYRCADPWVPLAPAPAWAVRWLEETPPPAPAMRPAPTLPESLPPVDVDTLAVSPRIRALIRTGRDPRYGSRSEATFATCLALVSAGYADAVIASVLLDPRYGIAAKAWAVVPRGDATGNAARRWVAQEIARARAKAEVEVFA